MPPPPSDQHQPPARAGRDAADRDDQRTQRSVEFQLTLTAEPAALSLIRQRLRAWLTRHRWSDSEIQDLVMVVSEAASNVVDHAYQHEALGTIDISGCVTIEPSGARVAELTVRDHGRWRPIPERTENRRRGIPLMKAAVAELVIDATEHGTCVRMRSRPVGPDLM